MDLINQLQQLYPAKQLFTKKSQLVAYETDGLTSFRSEPLAVVVPETQEQVIETVRLCHKAGVPFMARGSGTSLSGGSMPVEGGVVITLNRFVGYTADDNLDTLLAETPIPLDFDPPTSPKPENADCGSVSATEPAEYLQSGIQWSGNS